MAMDLSKMMQGSGGSSGEQVFSGGSTLASPAPPPRKTDSHFRLADHLGAWAARWGIGRMGYRVEPGLWSLGEPGPDSPVMVTCNYKLTFDLLRRDLAGLSVWILVLDTKGVNVWCAAGKGTFGTTELVARLASSGLADRVNHRRLILPQLGATGVSAPAVRTLSGWKVLWGPVRSADLKAWMDAGMKADEVMREVFFPVGDRLVLTPIELVQALKFLPGAPALAALFALPASPDWLGRFTALSVWLGLSVPVGAIIFPLLLPFLPGKGFGMRSLFLGLVSGIGLGLLLGGPYLIPGSGGAGAVLSWTGMLEAISVLGIFTGVVVWLGMNFTGATTWTSPTGTLTELRKALPWLAAGMVLALGSGIASAVLSMGGMQ